MKYQRWVSLIGMACCLAACGTPLQDQSYVRQYGHQGGRGQGFQAYPYQVSQEVHTCTPGEISGRINRLRVETFSPDMEPGLGIDVQTLDRGLVHVHVGPLFFLDRQEADLKPGDEVIIQGFCYKFKGQERLLASEINHKGNTLKLRDVQGKPYWEN